MFDGSVNEVLTNNVETKVSEKDEPIGNLEADAYEAVDFVVNSLQDINGHGIFSAYYRKAMAQNAEIASRSGRREYLTHQIECVNCAYEKTLGYLGLPN
mgnify:CR=1 FL=1